MYVKRCFLGANSRHGFRSLYGGFCPPGEGRFLNIIKGGPGCGKSSFMGRIASAAEEEGYAVEYVLCSGDPASLDGIFIPALGLGYVDGTAPHAMEAVYPGAASAYLDLGRFYDSAALRGETDKIAELNRRYKALYSLAYARIASAVPLLPKYRGGFLRESAEEKLDKKLSSLLRREFPTRGGEGKARECFLSAISCKGSLFLTDALESDTRIISLDNELGLGHIFLQKLLPCALSRGYDCVIVRDHLDPELISGLLFPDINLALLCSDLSAEEVPEPYRHMRLDALVPTDELSSCRSSMRRSRKLARECLGLAVDALSEAKALHDELEAIYNPHVDFDGVYAEAGRHISLLFG